ncbi:MAG TPA: hypothetical protein VG937_06235 [Polyangiaceae bacterium]|nr:hypothetical protein [Polyangiaceae bacterium]
MSAANRLGVYLKTLARSASPYWLALVSLTAIAFLWRPRLVMPETNIDAAWQLAINQIVVDGLDFGKQVIFTFGPLGRVYTSYYHPELFAVHCIVAGLLAVLYVWLLHRLVSISFRNSAVRAGLMFLLVPVTAITDVFWYSFAPLGLIALLIHRRPDDDVLESFFWFGMALLSLIKSSFGISTTFLWGAEFGLCLAMRRLRWALAVFPIGGLLIWVGEGQSLTSLPKYAQNTLAIAQGYGEAIGRPLKSLTLIAGYWLTLLSAAALLFYSLAGKESTRSRVVRVLTFLLLAWSLFKGGFTAGYMATAMGGALLMAACVWIACLGSLRHRFARIGFALSVVAGFLAVNDMTTLYENRNVFRYLIDQTGATAQLVADNFHDLQAGGREQAFEAAWARIRRKNRLPSLPGTVDVYRTEQSLALAHNMKWNPRLVFQSFAAYTPSLIEQNRQHLLGPSSPDSLILDLSTVDDRYPMLDDGISLLEILSRYKLVGLPRDLALFVKRTSPIKYRLDHLRTINARFATDIHVPGDEHRLLWVCLDFQKSLGGRLAFLYRAPLVDLGVRLADGQTKHYRIIPTMTGAGFLLSPLVATSLQYAFLNDESAAAAPTSAQVVGIEVTIEDGFEWMYKKRLGVRLYEVKFEAWDHAEGFEPEQVAAMTTNGWTKRPSKRRRRPRLSRPPASLRPRRTARRVGARAEESAGKR